MFSDKHNACLLRTERRSEAGLEQPSGWTGRGSSWSVLVVFLGPAALFLVVEHGEQHPHVQGRHDDEPHQNCDKHHTFSMLCSHLACLRTRLPQNPFKKPSNVNIYKPLLICLKKTTTSICGLTYPACLQSSRRQCKFALEQREEVELMKASLSWRASWYFINEVWDCQFNKLGAE